MDKIEGNKQIKLTIPRVGGYRENNWRFHTFLEEL